MLNYKEELNKEQFDAVQQINGPLLIIAGAGTGKTKTLIHRVAYLIDNGVQPENILLLTFTNAAANEMKKRAVDLLDERCKNITACTYHSFCAKMLRKYGKYINLPSDFSIITPNEVNDAIGLVKAQNKKYAIKGFPRKAECAGIFSECINKCISLELVLKQKKFSKFQIYFDLLRDLQEDFIKYKEDKKLLDYDDLLIYFKRLLDNDFMLKYIGNMYKYIMVDEYQDTNNIQEEIILKLSQNHHNIAVVGDDYQSIYAFRGSNINNILDFPRKFNICNKVILNRNYRSTQEILNLANNIMDKYANFGFKKNMLAENQNRTNGTLPQCICVDTTKEEADFILNKIKQLQNEGIPLNEIAVLERSSFSSFGLENLLNICSIPYEKYGGLKFLEHECILNVLAYLRCITNPYDELAWFRILQLHPGIGETYASRISQKCNEKDFLIENKYKNKTFYEELILLNNEIERFKDILDFKIQLNEVCEFYIKLRQRVIENMQVEDEENRLAYLFALEADKKTLNVLKDMAADYISAIKFLDAIMLDAMSNNDNQDKLIISTIHSAKGLEFHTVFIMDCIDGVFPSTNDPELDMTVDKDTDMEELRCFYVAITRAKENLYLMVPQVIFKYGQVIPGKLSHYLNENEEYYEIIEA